MAEEIVNISEFDWRTLPKSFTAIAIGPPESGKTYLMQWLAYALKHVYPVGHATCGTEGSQGAFTPIFGPLFTDNEYSEETQIRLAKRQKKCIDMGIYPYALTFVDDCSDDPKIYKQKVMKASFKNGRQHWKRAFIVGLQYGLDMTPDIRKSVSLVILFREPDLNERKKIYDNFGGICGTFKNFCALMDQFTGNNQFLVINKFSKSNKIEDCVYWGKAPAWVWQSDGKVHPYPEGWSFGCHELKQWNKDRYNTHFKEEIV